MANESESSSVDLTCIKISEEKQIIINFSNTYIELFQGRSVYLENIDNFTVNNLTIIKVTSKL